MNFRTPNETHFDNGHGWIRQLSFWGIDSVLLEVSNISMSQGFTRLLTFVVGIVFCCASQWKAPAQSWITNELVAYYPFNGNAVDASGNGHDGTSSGAALTPDRFGVTSRAYLLNGSGAHVAVPHSAAFNFSNKLSITAWFRADGGGLYQPRIVTKTSFDLGLYDTSANPRVFINLVGVGFMVGPSITAGRYYFASATYDGTQISLYLNGIRVAQTNKTGNLVSNSLNVGIGRNLETGTDWFKGTIDDVRLYSRSLSSEEVAQLYAIESGAVLNVRRAVYLDSTSLLPGTNYQLQFSTNLVNWTNSGTTFTATTNVWRSTNYWDVENWDRLFFRFNIP